MNSQSFVPIEPSYETRLRDRIALAILPSVLEFHSEYIEEESLKPGNGSPNDVAADVAYTYADAMIERRAK